MRILNFLDKEDFHISFMKYRRLNHAICLSLMILSLSFVALRGLNLGIDFSGGILIEAHITDGDPAKLREVFKDQDQQVQIQNLSDDIFIIRVQKADSVADFSTNLISNQSDFIKTIKKLLAVEYSKIDYRKIDYVGPQIGSELIFKGVMALLISFSAIMIYIWLRFDWQFGVGGILAIVHDAIFVLGFYAVTQIEFNLTSIAAILTVVGYSINDSVVIFDRIRDNLRRLKKSKIDYIVDVSLNSTLRRTILTSATTMISLLALLIFGGPVIQSFSAGAFVGVLIGTYSSIYVSAPVLTYIDPRETSKEEKR